MIPTLQTQIPARRVTPCRVNQRRDEKLKERRGMKLKDKSPEQSLIVQGYESCRDKVRARIKFVQG
jgi:hypothetical protein